MSDRLEMREKIKQAMDTMLQVTEMIEAGASDEEVDRFITEQGGIPDSRFHEDGFACPWCEEPYEPEERAAEMRCRGCGQKFGVMTGTKVTYGTWRIPG